MTAKDRTIRQQQNLIEKYEAEREKAASASAGATTNGGDAADKQSTIDTISTATQTERVSFSFFFCWFFGRVSDELLFLLIFFILTAEATVVWRTGRISQVIIVTLFTLLFYFATLVFRSYFFSFFRSLYRFSISLDGLTFAMLNSFVFFFLFFS